MKRFAYIGVCHVDNPTFPFPTNGFSFFLCFFRTRSNINHHKYDRFGKFYDQGCQDRKNECGRKISTKRFLKQEEI